MKSMMRSIGRAIQYVYEAAGRVFSPSDDKYPKTGVQPFEGEKSEKSDRSTRWVG